MKPLTLEKLKAATVVGIGLTGTLIFTTLQNFDGNIPSEPSLNDPPSQSWESRQKLTIGQLEEVFALGSLNSVTPPAGPSNPFYTEHYVPEPEPEPKPEPEPEPEPEPPEPKTIQVTLRYQGTLATPNGPRKAYVVIDGNLQTGTVGDSLQHGFQIEKIGQNSVTLSGPVDEPVTLQFRQQVTVEIPKEDS